MSAPIYELLKRPDELFVVEHAHLQPRFVEDSVRLSLKGALDAMPELEDGDFLFARQLNFETIHAHDVLAEREGTVGELRAELDSGEPPDRHTSLTDWLRALSPPQPEAALGPTPQPRDVAAVENEDGDRRRSPRSDHRPRLAEREADERQRGRRHHRRD